MIGGELPDAATLEAVRAALSAEDVRPLTDTVTVAAPEPVPYRIRGGWHLRRADSALAGNITAAVQAAVKEYRLCQRSAPGRDINPTRLISLVERAGVNRAGFLQGFACTQAEQTKSACPRGRLSRRPEGFQKP